MVGIIVGVVAGLTVLGGWWSLFGFCVVGSIAIASWRIFGAYGRLASGKDHLRKPSDARNIALACGAQDPDLAAVRFIEGGQLPKPTFAMYGRACAWEFLLVAACATVARTAKIFFFLP